MVRERLTGRAPPPAAKKLVDLWRPLIEDRAGKDLDRLEDVLDDQRQFGDAVRDLLDALEMGEDRSSDNEEDEEEGEEDQRKQEQGEEGDASESDDSSAPARRTRRPPPTTCPTLPRKPPKPRPPKWRTRARWATPRRRASRSGRAISAPTSRAVRIIAPSRRSSTRPSPPRICARRKNSTACAAISTSSLSNLQGVVARLANRLQRRLMAQQNRSWEFDLEEGMLDPARLSRIVIDPYASAVVQGGKGHGIPRHGGDAAARQFRLDARPSDHGRRHLRRHPRAHAGALRRQGRDSRLHHARLEGRAVARALARRRQAGAIPAASTTCATSSTNPPTRRGAARARISA